MRVITQDKTTFNYKYNYQVTSNVLDSLFEWVDGRSDSLHRLTGSLNRAPKEGTFKFTLDDK